jgi:serine/threonine protein kinase/Tol biopolymer transport system component
MAPFHRNMSLAPGVRLGAYEIIAVLGAGGMGEVYRARDTRVGRDVAIKILPAEVSSDPERLTRFEQEARASAALNHPNILALFDVGQHQGAPFIVSELLEGQTLRERSNGSPLPVRKAIELAIQVAQGLAAAHEKGIVHRDLKPENIFITADGRAKILDFGLAKLTQPEPALSGISVLPTTPPQTVPGVVLGTIGYMSPEQVRGHAADHRSDIFALGALLYEMLSGRRAFGGDTPMDAMSSILKEDPPDLPSTGDRPIPPALARIVDRCLEKNPAARFQSTRDLAFALEALSSLSGPATAIVQPISAAKRGILTRVTLAAGVAVFLAAAWLSVAHLRESPPELSVVTFTIAPPDGVAFSGGVGFAPAQALSPDGRLMVFMAQHASQRPMLWVRSLDSLESRPLPGTEGGTFPFWSPDNRSIAFFVQGKLRRLDIAGGPSQILGDASAGEGGTWNGEEVIVFAPSSAGVLYRVPADSGATSAVTTLNMAAKDVSHRWPHFLPDGRRFIFLVQPSNEIRLGSLDSPETRTLLKTDSKAVYASGYLLFVREDVLMAQPFDASRGELSGDASPVAENVRTGLGSLGRAAFSVSESGILTYRKLDSSGSALPTWFDRSGKELGTIGEAARYLDLQLSPDGERAAVVSAVQRNSDILLFDVDRGLSTKFTLDADAQNQPIWSPDGRRLLFGSAKTTGTSDLYIKPIDGSAVEELVLADNDAKFPFTWSPDGQFVIYGTAGSDQNLWVLSLRDRKATPFRQTPFSEFAAQFSPDGKWVAYRSNESGQSEIYVAPFPGPGEKIRISSTGAIGGYPRWRRDGKELFWLATDKKIMSAGLNVQGTALQVGEIRALFPARPSFGRFPFDVTADGQKFLVLTTPHQAVPEPVTVVLNWTATLRKRPNP